MLAPASSLTRHQVLHLDGVIVDDDGGAAAAARIRADTDPWPHLKLHPSEIHDWLEKDPSLRPTTVELDARALELSTVL